MVKVSRKILFHEQAKNNRQEVAQQICDNEVVKMMHNVKNNHFISVFGSYIENKVKYILEKNFSSNRYIILGVVEKFNSYQDIINTIYNSVQNVFDKRFYKNEWVDTPENMMKMRNIGINIRGACSDEKWVEIEQRLWDEDSYRLWDISIEEGNAHRSIWQGIEELRKLEYEETQKNKKVILVVQLKKADDFSEKNIRKLKSLITDDLYIIIKYKCSFESLCEEVSIKENCNVQSIKNRFLQEFDVIM